MKKFLLLVLMLLLCPSFYACKSEHTHNWGVWRDNYDGVTHSRVCKDNLLHTEEGDHQWNGGDVIKEVTDLHNGLIKYTCTDCGYSYQEIIPPTGNHNFTLDIADENHLYKNVSSATKVYYKSCADCGAFGNSEYLFEKTNLPENFIEVEYISSNGVQYIDTGYKASGDTHIIFKGLYNHDFSIYGGTPGFMNFTAETGTKLGYFYYDGRTSGASPKSSYANKIHVFEQNKNICLIDGKEIYRFDYSKKIDSNNLFLFGRNDNGNFDDAGGETRLYYCKIYDDDVLIRDYVPVQNVETNEYGVYDLVSEKFFGYSHKFKCGEIVDNNSLPEGYTEVEYLESTGTQYINTGVAYSNDIEYKFNCGLVFSSLRHKNQIFAGFTGNAGSGIGTDFEKWWPTQYDVEVDKYYDLEYRKFGSHYSYKFGEIEYANTNGNTEINTHQNLLLFASWHTAGSTNLNYFSECKFYYCKIFVNDALVRDFIPCIRNFDGIAGFYDRITEGFYTYSESFNYGELDTNSELPADYKQLEYIESNGYQRIDTGINEEATWEFDIKFLLNGKRQLMGYGGSGSEYWGVQPDGSYGIMPSTKNTIKAGNRDIVIFDYEGDSCSLKVNGNLITPISQVKLKKNFQIFALGANQDFECTAKLYGAKCYQNDILVRDFIPCVKIESKEVGLYDKVAGKFYGNIYDMSFAGGKISGHDFDEGKVLKETTYYQDGDIVYTCKICGKSLHEYKEKYSYKVNFNVDAGINSVKIYKDYNPENFEESNTAYTRNRNTFNYSRVNGIVICEIVLKDGMYIDKVTSSDISVEITKVDNRYVISNIGKDCEITITTTEKILIPRV